MIGTLRSYYVQAWLEGREKEKEEDEWSTVIVLEEQRRIVEAFNMMEAMSDGAELVRELMDRPATRLTRLDSCQVHVVEMKPTITDENGVIWPEKGDPEC